MLQWMGGARRKVASTRKSTQKRQKQYFEQRRMQQQAADGGNVFEGKNICGKQSENNRSLDIVSLLNLSTIAKEHKSTCGLANNTPEHDALSNQTVQPLQTIGRFQINETKSPVSFAIKETRSSSCYQPGNAKTKTTQISTPANDTRVFNSDNGKSQLKVSPENTELRMIDILGDEDLNVCSCKGSDREAHAAFSIEGLGEVEMETPVHTPVHSPETHCRTFLYGCSSPSKSMKPARSFNLDNKLVNLEFELDTMMQEGDLTLHKSSIGHSHGSKDRLGLFCEPKQALFDTGEFSLLNDGSKHRLGLFCEPKQALFDTGEFSLYGSKDRLGLFCEPKQALFDTGEFSLLNDSVDNFTDLLGDDEMLYHSRKSKKRHIWDATSTSQPHKILDESAFGLSYNDWTNQMDASADYFVSMNHWKKEFAFQGSYQPKRRAAIRESGKLEPTGSPAPYLKHQKSENFHKFMLPDMTWSSPVRRYYDFRDVVDQPTLPRYRNEVTTDNMSLLSEESCSSSAVKGVSKKGTLKGVSKKGTLNSNNEQMLESFDVASAEIFYGEYNMFGREDSCNKEKMSQEGESINVTEKFTRTSNPLRLKPAHTPNTSTEKKFKPDNGRLFEAAFVPEKASSGRNSCFRKSENTKPSSCSSRLWVGDVYDTLEDPKPDASGSCFEKFSEPSADSSPCCNFKSEEHDFHQPNLENSVLLSSMLNLCEDCCVGYRHSKSLHGQNSLATEQQSITRDADENSDVYTTEDEKCELERDASDCRKSLSSENGTSRVSPDIKDNCNGYKEFTDGTATVEGAEDMNCLERAEETSPAAETSNIIDGNRCQVDAICKLDSQSSVSCQSGVVAKLEAERFHPGKRTEGEVKKRVDSRCQVKMLDSCLLQFHCIQVLKEADAKVIGKHA